MMMNSSLFGSPVCTLLKNCIAPLLKCVILAQTNPIYEVCNLPKSPVFLQATEIVLFFCIKTLLPLKVNSKQTSLQSGRKIINRSYLGSFTRKSKLILMNSALYHAIQYKLVRLKVSKYLWCFSVWVLTKTWLITIRIILYFSIVGQLYSNLLFRNKAFSYGFLIMT